MDSSILVQAVTKPKELMTTTLTPTQIKQEVNRLTGEALRSRKRRLVFRMEKAPAFDLTLIRNEVSRLTGKDTSWAGHFLSAPGTEVTIDADVAKQLHRTFADYGGAASLRIEGIPHPGKAAKAATTSTSSYGAPEARSVITARIVSSKTAIAEELMYGVKLSGGLVSQLLAGTAVELPTALAKEVQVALKRFGATSTLTSVAGGAVPSEAEARKNIDAALGKLTESSKEMERIAELEKNRVRSKDKNRLDEILRPNGVPYQPRMLDDLTDIETIRACRERSIPVLLGGYPGCGKTAMTEAAFGEELVTVAGHGDSEVADFIGSYTQQTDGSYKWVDGPLVVAMKEGRPLFVDDCTLIPAPVLARLYPAMDGRNQITVTEHESEIITAKKGFYVLGAHNPGVVGAVLSEALASRFSLHLFVRTDFKLAAKFGIDPRIVRVTTELQEKRAKHVVSWAPEMRELLAYKNLAETLGEKIAVQNLVSIAPREARDDVEEALKRSFKFASPLELGGN